MNNSILGGIAEAFEDRNFRLYSVGSIVSWLSFFVQAVAVSWTTWELTHSTRWLAIVALMDAVRLSARASEHRRGFRRACHLSGDRQERRGIATLIFL